MQLQITQPTANDLQSMDSQGSKAKARQEVLGPNLVGAHAKRWSQHNGRFLRHRPRRSCDDVLNYGRLIPSAMARCQASSRRCERRPQRRKRMLAVPNPAIKASSTNQHSSAASRPHASRSVIPLGRRSLDDFGEKVVGCQSSVPTSRQWLQHLCGLHRKSRRRPNDAAGDKAIR